MALTDVAVRTAKPSDEARKLADEKGTRFAAPVVLACPRCDEPILQFRLASVNNCGATTWSDGFTSIIDFGGSQDIAVCASCESIFWVEDATQIGIMHREPESTAWPAWKRAPGHFNPADAATLAKERAWKNIPDSWHWAGKIESVSGTRAFVGA